MKGLKRLARILAVDTIYMCEIKNEENFVYNFEDLIQEMEKEIFNLFILRNFDKFLWEKEKNEDKIREIFEDIKTEIWKNNKKGAFEKIDSLKEQVHELFNFFEILWANVDEYDMEIIGANLKEVLKDRNVKDKLNEAIEDSFYALQEIIAECEDFEDFNNKVKLKSFIITSYEDFLDIFSRCLVEVLEWNIPRESSEFALKIIKGIENRIDEVDRLIKSFIRNWSWDKILPLDKSILRVGVGELLLGETPFKVVINEYIEISKIFSTEKSKSFINAILDKVSKEIKIK